MRVLLALALISSVGVTTAEVKVGFRQLGSTFPVVVQRGQASEITIRSNYTLDGAYSVLFDRPGITSKFLETKPIPAPRGGRGRPGTPFRFEVTVPHDQRTGIYEYRVATPNAVSSVAHLLVTDLPVTAEDVKKENGTPPSAQAVQIPVAVSGMCEKTEDVDCYSFHAQAGQSITFEVFAQRVTQAVHSMQSGNGTYLMDPILTLLTPTGQVIAQNDNYFGGDSCLTHTFQAEGDYVVSVRDARYIGNTKYVYCLQMSDRPWAEALFPMAVQRGQSATLSVIGHQLGETSVADVDTSGEDIEFGWQKTSVQVSGGLTNPVPLLVSEHKQVTAADGTHSDAHAVTVPVGVSGRFTEAGQSHRFRFDAKKGTYYRFDVTANRVGTGLDAILELYDANGKKLTEADDGLQTKDPTLNFLAPADGELTVLIRDLHDRGGRRFQYHLAIEESGPDFEVHGEYYYSQLAPGTRMAWFARVNRLNGFTGPVQINVEGLPDGVSHEPVTIPSGLNHCLINLVADKDAKVSASLATVTGTATVTRPDGSEQRVTRSGRITCELQTQGGGQARWPIRTSIVGVTQPLDLLEVVATPTEVKLKRGGKVEFTIRIRRNEGFKEPVTIAMDFTYFSSVLGAQLPTGVTVSKESTGRLSGDTLEGKIVLEATDKALQVERLPIAVLARVPITFSITTNYASNPVYLTVE